MDRPGEHGRSACGGHDFSIGSSEARRRSVQAHAAPPPSTRAHSAMCSASSGTVSPSSPRCTKRCRSVSACRRSPRCRSTRRWCCSVHQGIPVLGRDRGQRAVLRQHPVREPAGGLGLVLVYVSRTPFVESTGPLPNSASPVITGSLAHIDCSVHSVHDGATTSGGIRCGAITFELPERKPRPLLFYRGVVHRHRAGQEHPRRSGAMIRGVPDHHHRGHLALDTGDRADVGGREISAFGIGADPGSYRRRGRDPAATGSCCRRTTVGRSSACPDRRRPAWPA